MYSSQKCGPHAVRVWVLEPYGTQNAILSSVVKIKIASFVKK
jgi:hypothetical protein